MAEQKPKCPECGGNNFSVKHVDYFINIVYCASCGHIIGVAYSTVNSQFIK